MNKKSKFKAAPWILIHQTSKNVNESNFCFQDQHSDLKE